MKKLIALMLLAIACRPNSNLSDSAINGIKWHPPDGYRVDSVGKRGHDFVVYLKRVEK